MQARRKNDHLYCFPFKQSTTQSLSRNSSDSDLPSTGNGDADAGPKLAPAHLQRPLFTRKSKAIIWGMQTRAVQGMMDFDYVCSRSEPSIVAMVYPMV